MNSKLSSSILAICLIWIILSFQADAAMREETENIQKLRKFLINSTKYDRTVQPVDSHDKTTVNITIHPKRLRYLYPQWNYLSISAYMCMQWKDDNLKWEKSQFSGLSEIEFGPDEIWVPSVYLLESYFAYSVHIFSSIKADYRGNLAWCPESYMGLYCKMDLKDFPNDKHTCTNEFVSWTPHGYPVKLVGKLASDVFEDTHPDWHATLGPFKESTYTHPQFGAEPSISVTISISRRTSNFYFTIVLPLSVVSLLTLVVFWLPPSSGKKITIGCANLIIISLLIMIFEQFLDRAVHTTDAVKKLGVTTVFIGISVIISALVLNMVKSPIIFRPPFVVVGFLTGPFGKFFLLCPLPTPKSVDHVQLTDATTPVDKEDVIRKQEWFLVAQFLDRIAFVLFAIILMSYPM